MSYAIDLGPEAVAIIKSLAAMFAESILDEIDRIADDPASFELMRAYPFVGFDQKYIFQTANRIVTLFIRLDDQNRTLHVQNISVQGD